METVAVRKAEFDQLRVTVYPNTEALGRAAAEMAVAVLSSAIAQRGRANLVLATGNSQLAFLAALRIHPGIDWPAVSVFHMDEYLGLPPGHPASFPLTLRRLLLDHVPVGNFYPVPGSAADVELACRAYDALIRSHPIDLCCLGIGENGHLAFNEPGDTDFDDQRWARVITLEEQSRLQQVGEGHFASLEDVPAQAITLTVPALRSARHLLCIAPEARKAEAVRRALLGPINPECPASILRQTPGTQLLLDDASAAGLP